MELLPEPHSDALVLFGTTGEALETRWNRTSACSGTRCGGMGL